MHPTSIKEFHLNMQILVFIIIDTVPAMLDKKSSFAGILKPKTDVSLISLFHCIIHIGNICAGLSETFYEKCHGYGYENHSIEMCKCHELSPVCRNVGRNRRP